MKLRAVQRASVDKHSAVLQPAPARTRYSSPSEISIRSGSDRVQVGSVQGIYPRVLHDLEAEKVSLRVEDRRGPVRIPLTEADHTAYDVFRKLPISEDVDLTEAYARSGIDVEGH